MMMFLPEGLMENLRYYFSVNLYGTLGNTNVLDDDAPKAVCHKDNGSRNLLTLASAYAVQSSRTCLMILGSHLSQSSLKSLSVVADIAVVHRTNSSNHIRSISKLDGGLDDL